MPGGRFTDRTVMVFGAAGALGAGIAAAFAGEGAGVIGVDRAEPAGDRRLGGARYHAVDVLDDGALAALFDEGPPPWAVVNTVGEIGRASCRERVEMSVVAVGVKKKCMR